MNRTSWTPEELEQIEQARLAWLAVYFDEKRGPADMEAAGTGIRAIYKYNKMPEPAIIGVTGPKDAARRFPEYPPQVWEIQPHDAHWIGWHRMAQSLGITYKKGDLTKLVYWEQVARACVWWWPFERAAVVCDWPVELHYERFGGTRGAERRRLHCADGPSLRMADGHSRWTWHGVEVPAEVIRFPEQITADQIDREQNAEIRSVLLQRYGLERYFSTFTPVQQDDFGKLYKKRYTDGLELAVVRVVNGTPEPDGSYKEYVIPVPPAISSAHEAVAITYGLTIREYGPETRT